MRHSTLVYLIRLILFTAALHVTTSITVSKPSDCIWSSKTISKFVKCLHPFIKLDNTVSFNDWWNRLRPNPDERAAWRKIVGSMLRREPCSNSSLGPLEGQAAAFEIVEESRGITHCILLETAVDANKTFAKGWGFFMAPSGSQEIQRPFLHFSAAHPITDGRVHHQAAVLYSKLGAKSLAVTGAIRWAVRKKGPCQSRYYSMDAAHSNETMFHAAVLETLQWQMDRERGGGGCTNSGDSKTCLFVQWHGMRNKSCPGDTVFLSVGHKNGSSMYQDPESAINRLKIAVKKASHNWVATTPATSKCILVASTNVFGRVINGVPMGTECDERAPASGINGDFLHIEQTVVARLPSRDKVWAKAFRAAMPKPTNINVIDKWVTAFKAALRKQRK